MTATDPSSPPAMRTIAPALARIGGPRISPRGWLLLWGLTVAFQVILLANNAAVDTFLWRSTRWLYGDNPQQHYSWADYKAAHAADPAPQPFYTTHDPPMTRVGADGRLHARLYAQTEVWWTSFKAYAENLTIFLLIVGVSILHRKRWKAGVMYIAAAMLAGGISSLVRIVAGRYRPVAPPGDGINHWEFFRGFHAGGGTNLSWPSGHATAAFATAAVLSYLAPMHLQRPARWFFVIVAAGTAYARVIQEAHYYADVLMAAAIGWTVAWLTCQWLDRLIPDPAPAADRDPLPAANP